MLPSNKELSGLVKDLREQSSHIVSYIDSKNNNSNDYYDIDIRYVFSFY